MKTSRQTLPLDYLAECSDKLLDDYILEQMSHAANLRGVILTEIEQLVNTLVNVEVGRLLRNKELSTAVQFRRGARKVAQIAHDQPLELPGGDTKPPRKK